MNYKNPVPVVVALLRAGAGLLAVQRGIPPKLGGWAFPGGYVNEGENAEEAISREVHEETGFLFEPTLWSPTCTLTTPNNQLLIFMSCSKRLEEELVELFTPTEEALALKVVSPDDELCFPLHTRVLRTLKDPHVYI